MSGSASSDDEVFEEFPDRKTRGTRTKDALQQDDEDTTDRAVKYASYVCLGHKPLKKINGIHERGGSEETGLVVLDESVTRNFDDQVQNKFAKTPTEGGAHIRLVLMSRDSGTFHEEKRQTIGLLETCWNIDLEDFELFTSQPVASYHSRIIDVNGDVCLDISYNIREDILYDQDNISSLESSLTVNAVKPADMRVQHEYEPIYFRYNLSTGQSTYILPNASREYRNLLHKIAANFSNKACQMHPFTLHAVFLFQSLAARSAAIHDIVRRLLWIETQIYQGSIFQGTESEKFIQYIQLSHKLSRNLITLEHRSQRDRYHIEKLLGDHQRFWRLSKRNTISICPYDTRTHEHLRDSLLSLKDSAYDQDRQIISAQRNTQLFITLLYNLITGHDSGINLRIASETAKVAQEAKKDSTSMKIIAGVTMFYLPATFVCSLFGTNFVALNTNTSEPTFVVSKLWWVYIAFAVPLTAITMFSFLGWRRWHRDPQLTIDRLEV